MKKIFVFILCLILIAAVPTVAFAEEISPDNADIPTTENGIATEGENSAPETEEDKPITEIIVSTVKEHIDTLSVIGALIVGIIYEIRKHKSLNGSIGTLNNNAITVAENSATAIKSALSSIEGVANVVNTYKDEITTLLAEIRQSAEEKKILVEMLNHVGNSLKTVKLATIELSNEVADLLVLANIPNSKKDELYARHQKAVHDLEAAEGVISNDGTEA